MATRTISVLGGTWSGTTTWDEGIVPTTSDDVVARSDGTSGPLTITNGNKTCRSVDLFYYNSTLTHSTTSNLNIGTNSSPASNIALRFSSGMTYSRLSASPVINFQTSVTTSTQTIDFAGSNLGVVQFNGPGSSYKLLSGNFTLAYFITHLQGTLDTNGYNFTTGSINSTGTNARTFTFGSSIISIVGYSTQLFTYSGSNLTISPNTATISTNVNQSFVCIDGTDFNGCSLQITGSTGTFTLANNCTFKNVSIQPASGTKTFSIVSGKTLTLNNGSFSHTGTVILKSNTTSSAANITLTNSMFDDTGITITDITFSPWVYVGFTSTLTRVTNAIQTRLNNYF